MRKLAAGMLCCAMLGCAGAKSPQDSAPIYAAETLRLDLPLCAAVWVSDWCAVTAFHCVEARTWTPTEQAAAAILGVAPDVDRDPTGAEGSYVSLPSPNDTDPYYVLRVDRENDLAALRTTANFPHPYARVGRGPIRIGDDVTVMGHPGFYPWTATWGRIAGIRAHERNASHHPMNTIQVDAAVSGGNSGGGIFNAHGELIGVTDYIDTGAHGQGFAVHQDTVRQFLVSAGCLYP